MEDSPTVTLQNVNVFHKDFYSDSILRELIHNIIIDSRFLTRFAKMKLPHIQTIWCEDATIPDDLILHEIFTFLKVIYLKSDDRYKRIPFKNKYLTQDIENVVQEETILTEIDPQDDKKYLNLTIQDLEIDNGTLLKLSKIIAPGCNLKFINCNLAELDFDFDLENNQNSERITWRNDIVPAFSSIYLNSLFVVFMSSIDLGFRDIWDESIATKRIYYDKHVFFTRTYRGSDCIHTRTVNSF